MQILTIHSAKVEIGYDPLSPRPTPFNYQARELGLSSDYGPKEIAQIQPNAGWAWPILAHEHPSRVEKMEGSGRYL